MKKSADTKELIHSDIEYVEGIVSRNPRIEKDFYMHCKRYFDEHQRAMFFVGETDIEEIFHDTFITMWRTIERGGIRIQNGVLLGRNGRQLICSLTTYLMSVARIKYREQVRSLNRDDCFIELPSDDTLNDCEAFMAGWLEESYENAMFEIISESISQMPRGCSQILTKFYYEKKCLDDIIREIPGYNSKDALKSNKNRCLNRLKDYVIKLYKSRKSK